MRAALHEAREQGVLVAAVARERHAAEARVPLGQALDDLPGAVARAVVHEQHVARGVGPAAAHQLVELGGEQPARDGQDLLLVVAGDDDADDGRLAHGCSRRVPEKGGFIFKRLRQRHFNGYKHYTFVVRRCEAFYANGRRTPLIPGAL